MKHKKPLLCFIIIFSLFTSLFSVSSLGISDINYTFVDDKLFDSDITSYEAPYNLKYQSEYTEIYNATYTFTNLDIGTSGIDIDWIDATNFGQIEPTISDSFIGHSKVLNGTNDGIGNKVRATSFLSNPVSNSTIEWWMATNDVSIPFAGGIWFLESGQSLGTSNILFIIDFDTSNIRITRGDESGGNIATDIESVINNQWYHIKVELDFTNDVVSVYFNNEFFNTYNFFNDQDFNDFSSIAFYLQTDDIYSFYLDAIGYSFGLSKEVHDFTDDIVGNEPIGWISNNDANCISVITANLDSHINILDLHDQSAVGKSNISLIFDNFINSSISFEIAKSSITHDSWIDFYEGNSRIISFFFDDNKLRATNGVSQPLAVNDFILNNVFGTILLIVHKSTQTYDIYANGILKQTGYSFENNFTLGINYLEYFTAIGQNTNHFYLDNILFDTEFLYTTGNNLIPFLNTSNTLMEVDKYEFAINDIHTFNAGGSSNPNGWTDVEIGGSDKVIIFPETDGSYDRLIRADTNVIDDIRGIKKDDFSISDKFVNVSVGFFCTIMDGSTSNRIEFKVNSSDDTNVVFITINSDLEVLYWNGSININIGRNIILGSANRYEFNILIDYELDIAFFQYIHNNILQETYIIYFSSGHTGLSEVQFVSLIETTNTLRYFIDYIGIYANSKSQVSKGVDFGIALIPINNGWNFENYNLFTSVGKGTFHLGASPTGYFEGFPFDIIKDTTVYNDFTQIFVNIHDKFVGNIADAKLVITVLGNNFNFSYLKISGVVLNEGSNSYILTFEHSGVNIQESFFFVDSNNKLQFTHISNDTDTEYIQARFNINDSTSTGARISFRSLINNNAKGFFRINYTTTSDFIPFPFVQSTTSIFLTQAKNIRDFLIIITDLDDDIVSGLTSGFIDNLKLLFLENVQITVITLSLIGMIIPLIIILTPTVALRELYGKSFVIPIFLLMSLILFIGGIIPLWLFFVIAISSSLFLIKENVLRDD